MGATYLSMQLRTAHRDAVIAALRTIAAEQPAAGLRFYVAERAGGWVAVFPNFTPELERSAKALSASRAGAGAGVSHAGAGPRAR